MRISIATKLIFLTISFLVIATAIFATQSSQLLETVLILREENSNRMQADALATEVDSIIGSAIERAQIIGTILYKMKNEEKQNLLNNVVIPAVNPDNPKLSDLDVNFNKDRGLVSLEVYKITATGYELYAKKVKEEALKQAGVGLDYIDKVRQANNFPIRTVAQKKIEIRNSTLPKKELPLVTIGIPLLRDENDNVTHVVVFDINLGVLAKPFSSGSERVLYLIDKNGELLAHQDEQKSLARLNFKSSPLVEKAIADPLPKRQIQFVDPEDKHTYIGAYVKNNNLGITTISQTDKMIILEPAKEVKRQAIKIAGYVISFAMFFIFLFSMSLTGPIEKLAEMIQLVSRGNFNVKARKFVKTNDEVGDLAFAFDNMTEGLKERDKVKNLFSKFHGSSVAEDLLKNDIAVGGTNKQVTIFFSDIRGFTAFSENKSPEEVVEMLNEYFAVMVSTINKYNGVVDKFIGDAIMAVWGAPHSSDKDTENALRACVEMRKGLEKLNIKRQARGDVPILIGMGLHSGRAISGTIGSSDRMEYTVIGDTVNMTSRIEASTKSFGTDLLVSEAVVEKVGEKFLTDYAGSAEVKGKTEPLKLFKVRGYVDENGAPVEVITPWSEYAAGKDDKIKIAG